MKKSFVSLLAFAAVTLGLVSCGGNKKQNAAEQDVEKEAVIAGEVSKNLLTLELKTETAAFLKDMPVSDLPQQLSSGEVVISVANTEFMLPVNKLADLNTKTQKARACGMYFADATLLQAMNKPVQEIQNLLMKLATDLDITFAVDIMKDAFPSKNKEEMDKYLQARSKFIDAMIENNKPDVLLEILGGMTVEYSLVYANPGLVVKGNATSTVVDKNMQQRLKILQDITKDLAKYYPDLQIMGKTLAPLDEILIPISTARESRTQIEGMRTDLLK